MKIGEDFDMIEKSTFREVSMKIIAHIETDFPEKFGIPRQSGLVEELKGRIVFEPEYNLEDAVKGIEDFNYIWLLWRFDVPEAEHFQATVRPPRLGGNETRGVFASRSPFRPNSIGLSSVRLERVEYSSRGPVLHVAGADLKDGTAIYDIKPYLHYVDCHEDATDGFARLGQKHILKVDISPELLGKVPGEKQDALLKVLSLDPRPSYQEDEGRIYGMKYADFDIHFQVSGDLLTVTGIDR